jgi:cytochrome c oxidase subunit 2
MTNTPLLLQQAATNPPKLPPSDDFWMPRASSVTVDHVDWIWHFMVWVSALSALLILGAMVYFCFKYKATSRKANELSEPSTDHNTTLEIAWSIIPMFVVVALFVWGFRGYMELRTPPQGALEIRATGQKWKWLFEYPHGTDDVLHVPVNQPVRVIINSVDVLHSLYMPNFRTKMDAVPGRYTELWFNATEAGEFPIFCAEYCGTSHSDMLSRVVVHEPGGYEKWVEEVKKKIEELPPVELGKLMVEQNGCTTCHSTDGTPKVGPTWKGMFGHDVATSAGNVKVDENYIRESILDPQAKIVSGFAPAMPTYKGKLSDKKVDGIIAYLKTLQ